jgi:hypothetical protein
MHIIPVEIIGEGKQKVRAKPSGGRGVVAAGGGDVSEHNFSEAKDGWTVRRVGSNINYESATEVTPPARRKRQHPTPLLELYNKRLRYTPVYFHKRLRDK